MLLPMKRQFAFLTLNTCEAAPWTTNWHINLTGTSSLQLLLPKPVVRDRLGGLPAAKLAATFLQRHRNRLTHRTYHLDNLLGIEEAERIGREHPPVSGRYPATTLLWGTRGTGNPPDPAMLNYYAPRDADNPGRQERSGLPAGHRDDIKRRRPLHNLSTMLLRGGGVELQNVKSARRCPLCAPDNV